MLEYLVMLHNGDIASARDKANHIGEIPLFVLSFASASILTAGAVTTLLTIFPILFAAFASHTYVPQLPTSEERTGEFVELFSNEHRHLYSSLPSSDIKTAPAKHSLNWIKIPSIDVAVPLVMSPSMEDTDVLTTLSSGAALYPNGVVPGRLGNAFISAHSTGEPWKGAYRFAFLRIGELDAGNVIHIDYQGTRYTYTITEIKTIVPTPETLLVSDRPVPTLTLMACWPLWSTKQRMLIKGDLTHVTKLTPEPA